MLLQRSSSQYAAKQVGVDDLKELHTFSAATCPPVGTGAIAGAGSSVGQTEPTMEQRLCGGSVGVTGRRRVVLRSFTMSPSNHRAS
jgi:hypothetical protein